MSHLIPLIIFFALLYYGRRKAKRIAPPPGSSGEARSSESLIETIERLAERGDTFGIIEEIAGAGIATLDSGSKTSVVASSVPSHRGSATAVPQASRQRHEPVRHPNRGPRYLLDGVDKPTGSVDRVARLQKKMGGRGLCSPR
jgi:hypothetical protein